MIGKIIHASALVLLLVIEICVLARIRLWEPGSSYFLDGYFTVFLFTFNAIYGFAILREAAKKKISPRNYSIGTIVATLYTGVGITLLGIFSFFMRKPEAMVRLLYGLVVCSIGFTLICVFRLSKSRRMQNVANNGMKTDQ